VFFSHTAPNPVAKSQRSLGCGQPKKSYRDEVILSDYFSEMHKHFLNFSLLNVYIEAW